MHPKFEEFVIKHQQTLGFVSPAASYPPTTMTTTTMELQRATTPLHNEVLPFGLHRHWDWEWEWYRRISIAMYQDELLSIPTTWLPQQTFECDDILAHYTTPSAPVIDHKLALK
eukprot:TRINITY_DN3093_c0_g1_i1.p1 TRINITY_DN3093_c0_g1~~TRINITY_DN3093_c0_g1_i1.p1  ORF type:complete len:114 (+),score=22.93 TRINITY_DN3093_c0_g1_i1:398-739(+)